MKTLNSLVFVGALVGIGSLVTLGTGCVERTVVRANPPPPRARVVVVPPPRPIVTEQVYVR